MTAEPRDRAQDTPGAAAADTAATAHVRLTAVQARLTALQACAAAAYDEITAADAALRALARRRVTSERAARHAAAVRAAAARAAAACERDRPRLPADVGSGFRARSRWRARQAELDAALSAAQPPLAAARRALAEIRDEFAAQVQARAEAVTALRQVTAQCAAARAQLAANAGIASSDGGAG
jgi:chromosome segregation ATPase